MVRAASMDQMRLTNEEFERAISLLVGEAELGRVFEDGTFDTVARLLDQFGKPQWSLRPRTYTVLRMINRADCMDNFVVEGLRDINLPFTYLRLPRGLDEAAKHGFIEKQATVLTKANDLELENGRHKYFSNNADCYFRIIKTLGSGKFGIVDHVQSKLSLGEYARKRIHRRAAFSRDREAMRIFENELRNLKRLRHAHLVSFIGSYTDPKYIGILTTPVAEWDLKRFLERSPFPPGELSLLRQFFGCLCSALQYLHDNKCRHKDIKPGNILVKNQEVFITDFGTARDWSDRTRGTTTGPSGPYTPRFAAPEVVNAESRNESSDIWSLGCVYLDLMTVLKGRRVDEMTAFFSQHGSGWQAPHSNSEALELWMQELATSRSDVEPLRWIKQMLDPRPLSRPGAAGLLEMILDYEDENECIFYGHCCFPASDSEWGSIGEGSVFEDATQNDFQSSEATAYPRPLGGTILTKPPRNDGDPDATITGRTPSKDVPPSSKFDAPPETTNNDEGDGAKVDPPSAPSDNADTTLLPSVGPLAFRSKFGNYRKPTVESDDENNEMPDATTTQKGTEDMEPLAYDTLIDARGSSDPAAFVYFDPDESDEYLPPWQPSLLPSPLSSWDVYGLYGNMLDLIQLAHTELCALRGVPNEANPIPKRKLGLIFKYRLTQVRAHGYEHLHFFSLLGAVFDTFALGRWICGLVAERYGADTSIFSVAGRLWQALLELECRLVILARGFNEWCSASGRPAPDTAPAWERGREILSRLETILRRCEAKATRWFPNLLESDASLNIVADEGKLGRSVRREFVEGLFTLQDQTLELLLLEMQEWNEEFREAFGKHLGSCFAEPVKRSLYPDRFPPSRH